MESISQSQSVSFFRGFVHNKISSKFVSQSQSGSSFGQDGGLLELQDGL
jgi:hypothetical protein